MTTSKNGGNKVSSELLITGRGCIWWSCSQHWRENVSAIAISWKFKILCSLGEKKEIVIRNSWVHDHHVELVSEICWHSELPARRFLYDPVSQEAIEPQPCILRFYSNMILSMPEKPKFTFMPDFIGWCNTSFLSWCNTPVATEWEGWSGSRFCMLHHLNGYRTSYHRFYPRGMVRYNALCTVIVDHNSCQLRKIAVAGDWIPH